MRRSVFNPPLLARQVPTMWVVERLDVDGEELPVLRHAKTWLPAPIALRYVLRTRFRLGPASLTNDLRAIAILYNWSEATEGVGDFEYFLTSGHILSRDQLLSFIPHLLCRRYYEPTELDAILPASVALPPLVGEQTFNTRLFAVSNFLEWAIEPTNHGGGARFDEDERDKLMFKTIRLFENEKLPVRDSPRREPLTVAEVQLIRRAIAPDEHGRFQPHVFTADTRYRNWIMFETALNIGVRKGELLTLKVAHLPASRAERFFTVPRQQDTPEDPRNRRRLRGKTNERRVPLMDPNLLPSILGYRDAAPPFGRNDSKISTPYLFVTRAGRPVSSTSADYIIRRIGRYAARTLDHDHTLDECSRALTRESLLGLTWHRLRHTWAELAALSLYRRYGARAWATLKEWGGWNSDESMQRYVENAKRQICDEAARKYLSSYNRGG